MEEFSDRLITPRLLVFLRPALVPFGVQQFISRRFGLFASHNMRGLDADDLLLSNGVLDAAVFRAGPSKEKKSHPIR